MTTAGKVIRCKAAVALEAKRPLSVVEVFVAPPKAHEVRVKIVAAGVCQMDWEALYKAQKSSTFPVVLGHEGAGVVESVGPGVTKFSPGDKVIPLFLPYCGECEQCLNPKTNLCRKNWASSQAGLMADWTSRISSVSGQLIYQFLGVGSFAQYAVVSDVMLAKIRHDAPLEEVCLLGCGVSTGYGAALNAAKVQENSTCAVFGLGAVGLGAVAGCREAKARRIIGLDMNPNKFQKAKELGATDCVSLQEPAKPMEETVVEMTGGGVDFALECSGGTQVMKWAFDSTRDGWGTCVVTGWAEKEEMSVPVSKLLMGRTLKGTYFGGWKGALDVPGLVDRHMNGTLKLDEFITHKLPLPQINTAFDLLKSGESICSVISLFGPEKEDKSSSAAELKN